MQLEKHQHTFASECRQLIGQAVQKVEYVENNYYPRQPKPCFTTDHPQVHTVDFSVRLLTGGGQVAEIFWKTFKIYWEKEFVDYGLNIRYASLPAQQNQQTWNVSGDRLWQDCIGETITDVQVHWTKTWFESSSSSAVMDFTFPKTVSLCFSNEKTVYVSASEYGAGHRFQAAKGINHLLVTTNEAVERTNLLLTR